jgi:hypothetical protein
LSNLDSIRQQVLERVSVRDCAIQCGFRPTRGPSGKLHSGFREDKNPSCSIKGDYITDWGTGTRWNVIDLTMQSTGCNYIQALRQLAEEVGIPWPTATQRDIQEARDRRPMVARIAADAADWIHGLRLAMDKRKRALVRAAKMAWYEGSEESGDALMELVGRIPRAALNPEGADSALIVRAYRASAMQSPAATRRVMASGRADRENAERVTELIVALLAESQPVKAGAEVTAC